MSLTTLSLAEFKQIVGLLEQKEALQSQVSQIDAQLAAFGGGSVAAATVPPVEKQAPAAAPWPGKRKITISPAGRARIAEAQRARWAKKKGTPLAAAKPAVAAKVAKAGKPQISAAGRARIAEAQRARWAKKKGLSVAPPAPATVKPAKGPRRGAVKDAIIGLVKAAGKTGISVKDVAAKLKAKPQGVYVWFGTTGRKISEIKKVGPAKYAWVG